MPLHRAGHAQFFACYVPCTVLAMRSLHDSSHASCAALAMRKTLLDITAAFCTVLDLRRI